MNCNGSSQILDEDPLGYTIHFPHMTGELGLLLRDIAFAAKRVHVEVNKAGLTDILGDAGTINVQGEVVSKLDVFANDLFIDVLRQRESCAAMASEENEDIIVFDDRKNRNGRYVVLIDPIDGSSNIDVNAPIGSVFSIYRRQSERGKQISIEDFLQTGNMQVAAGYIVYASSTMFVYATGAGVNGFTLDQGIGEFTLSHPNIRCPDTGNIYSVNHGNLWQYNENIRKYIDRCQKKQRSEGGPYTERYIGSMVADIHRNLIKGGIFLYPPTISKPHGKLRLLYECNPLAYIVEKAGGKATNGRRRILDVKPDELHQRSALFIGSMKMMEELEIYTNKTD